MGKAQSCGVQLSAVGKQEVRVSGSNGVPMRERQEQNTKDGNYIENIMKMSPLNFHLVK